MYVLAHVNSNQLREDTKYFQNLWTYVNYSTDHCLRSVCHPLDERECAGGGGDRSPAPPLDLCTHVFTGMFVFRVGHDTSYGERWTDCLRLLYQLLPLTEVKFFFIFIRLFL